MSSTSERPFRILFVCTGNTCRSPMAEALARREVEVRGWTGVEVASAGVAAATGMGPSPGALQAAAEAELDLSGHRSRPLRARDVEEADLVLAMSPSHLGRIAALGGEDRMALITEAGEPGGSVGVPDPFGGDVEVYRETYRVLEDLVRRVLDRIVEEVDP